MTPEIASDARTLLLRHPLRAGDAVQLANCLYLQRQLAQPVRRVRWTIGEGGSRRGFAVITPRGRQPSSRAEDGPRLSASASASLGNHPWHAANLQMSGTHTNKWDRKRSAGRLGRR